MNLLPLLPITCGYARVSKSDDEARNLDTQLLLLANHGIREDLIFTDVASGRTMNRPGWRALMDRFSRHFEEGVRIRAELTARDIGIVALREHIDTTQNSAAAKFFRKFFRRSMLAQGAYQVDSSSERIKLGLARAGGNRVGRRLALTPEQVERCRRMPDGGWGCATSPG